MSNQRDTQRGLVLNIKPLWLSCNNVLATEDTVSIPGEILSLILKGVFFVSLTGLFKYSVLCCLKISF